MRHKASRTWSFGCTTVPQTFPSLVLMDGASAPCTTHRERGMVGLVNPKEMDLDNAGIELRTGEPPGDIKKAHMQTGSLHMTWAHRLGSAPPLPQLQTGPAPYCSAQSARFPLTAAPCVCGKWAAPCVCGKWAAPHMHRDPAQLVLILDLACGQFPRLVLQAGSTALAPRTSSQMQQREQQKSTVTRAAVSAKHMHKDICSSDSSSRLCHGRGATVCGCMHSCAMQARRSNRASSTRRSEQHLVPEPGLPCSGGMRACGMASTCSSGQEACSSDLSQLLNSGDLVVGSKVCSGIQVWRCEHGDVSTSAVGPSTGRHASVVVGQNMHRRAS